MDKSKLFPRRVFINDVDSFASGNIAKFLSECMVMSLDHAGGEIDTEDDVMMSEDDGKTPAFHVVGTTGRVQERREHLLEEYLSPDRDELLSKMLRCDVVVYNITQQAEQVEEASWAVSALHNKIEEFSEQKIFILVSTVMTWACSKAVDPDDPELPFTDELFWRRKAHPNFKPHIDLEKRVAKLGKTNRAMFSTYVVASGLQYGMGEQVLHYFFKTSWLGKTQDLTVFGDGNNVIPMIHIRDLASVIQNVIQYPPKPYYLLAVDNSDNTMMRVAKAIACALGRGTIETKPVEEAFLISDLSVIEIDSMMVNLRMEAVHIRDLFSINWLCASGLVKNIGRVVEEYRHTRRLLPIRVCVLGPPAVGKSTISKHISKYFKLHHIKLKETISQTLSQLETAVKNPDPDAENNDAAVETQRFLTSLKESMEQNEGLLEDQLLVKVVKDKLMSNPCKNQGFVLDGFPKSYEQAMELFSDEQESEDVTFVAPPKSKRILPECVVYLDSTDELLRDRVMNLPEKVIQEHNYEQDHFLGRLSKYRENNAENDTVLQYFDEIDISPLHIDITSNNQKESLPLIQKIYDTIGLPRNYGPSPQEEQEEQREDDDEERFRRQALEKAEEERRTSQWQEWTERLQEAVRAEEEMLETQSLPIREYLKEQLMPTLTQGLIQCCKVRPANPEEYLAEYLLKNNPSNF